MTIKSESALKAWLEEVKATGALSDEELQVLESAASKPQVDTVSDKYLMRQSDYSRKLDQARTDYETKSQEILAYERELANWRANTEKSVSQLQTELTQARAERERLVRTAQTYGLSEDDLGGSVAPFTTPPGTPSNPTNLDPQKPAIDPATYLSKAEAEELGTMYTLLPAEINDIVAEHVELFGKQPRGMRQVVERAIKERRQLRDVYEEEFKVADRRKEIETAQREAEIKRRVDEEITRRFSENPEGRIPLPGRQGSYVLANKDKLTQEGSTQVDTTKDYLGSSEAVRAAVAHWHSIDHSNE